MKVAKDRVVSLAYQLRTKDGVLIDESRVRAPLEYLHGHGSLIPGLEKRWGRYAAGDSFDISIEANDAYTTPTMKIWCSASLKMFYGRRRSGSRNAFPGGNRLGPGPGKNHRNRWRSCRG